MCSPTTRANGLVWHCMALPVQSVSLLEKELYKLVQGKKKNWCGGNGIEFILPFL